jgi:hypothetical protein
VTALPPAGPPPWKRKVPAAPLEPGLSLRERTGGLVVRPLSELPPELRPVRRLDETTDEEYSVFDW